MTNGKQTTDESRITTAVGKQQLVAVGLVVLIVLSGCSTVANTLTDGENSAEQSHSITFENATASSGLDYENTGSGTGASNNAVYASDVDNDGWTDLMAVGGKRPALFHNEEGTFERQSSFPNVTKELKSGIFVDYDGDGWDDIILFAVESEPVVLHNDEGTFERTTIGLGNLTYPLGATAADYDGDGDRDLFVYQSGNWANHKPRGYFSVYKQVKDDNGNRNYLYENTGDGFERVNSSTLSAERWSLAASFVDLTGDGRPDIHVANDFNNDTIYINQGDGTFEERLLGGATARNGMSSEVADVTGDGKLDIFVTNIEIPLKENRDEMGPQRFKRLERFLQFVIKSGRTKGNTLLINQGNGTFVDKADAFNVRRGGWGWAASFTDFNNDGRRDLIHTTQHVVRVDKNDPTWTLPMVWKRNATGFNRVNKSVHGMTEHDSRGMTTLDFDHDGDRDVALATYKGPVVLYENTVEEGNALQFEVVDENGATALGANVTVSFGDQKTVVRQTDESDFFSQEPRMQHVGLGDAETATLRVTWPDGTERTFEVDANQQLRLTKDGVTVTGNLTG